MTFLGPGGGGRVLNTLNGRDARRWADQALNALGRLREEIDALNVFPVPDGDTGTNLYLTLEAACAEALKAPAGASPRELGAAFARGALLGARGNSGVIVAQLLQGWAEVFSERGLLDADAVKRAMVKADEQAWSAVGSPVSGTILTVSRAAVHAAQDAGDRLDEVVVAATQAARKALAHTPVQLESLRKAGVVDAGGRGLLVLLETLEGLVREVRVPSPGGNNATNSDVPGDPGRPGYAALPTDRAAADATARGQAALDGTTQHLAVPDLAAQNVAEPERGTLEGAASNRSDPAYEVMYVLHSDTSGIETLRARLTALGDCLAVVGGEGLWHVHVHVDDPGAAVEAGIGVGELSQIRIEHLTTKGPVQHLGVGLVACASGPGLSELFSQVGAVPVRVGPGKQPTADLLLEAIRSTHTTRVTLLPNDRGVLALAQEVVRSARELGIQVAVVPTLSPVQGLAAAAVHEPDRSLDEDAARLSAAAGATRFAAVSAATGEIRTPDGVCQEGQFVGSIQGEPVLVDSDPGRLAARIISQLLEEGGELLTLVTGDRAPADLLQRAREGIDSEHVEVSEHDGGQPCDLLLIGVE